MRHPAFLAILLLPSIAVSQERRDSGAGADSIRAEAGESVGEADGWDLMAAGTAYFGFAEEIYVVPVVAARLGGFHLEGRYNYEDFHTASLWAGRHATLGNENRVLEVALLAGWVVGRTEGFAPGLILDLVIDRIEFHGEIEHVFPSDDSESFLYNRSDLTYSWMAGLTAGLAVEYTRYSGSEDFQPGVLIGCSGNNISVNFSLFEPAGDDPRGALEVALYR